MSDNNTENSKEVVFEEQKPESYNILPPGGEVKKISSDVIK